MPSAQLKEGTPSLLASYASAMSVYVSYLAYSDSLDKSHMLPFCFVAALYIFQWMLSDQLTQRLQLGILPIKDATALSVWVWCVIKTRLLAGSNTLRTNLETLLSLPEHKFPAL